MITVTAPCVRRTDAGGDEQLSIVTGFPCEGNTGWMEKQTSCAWIWYPDCRSSATPSSSAVLIDGAKFRGRHTAVLGFLSLSSTFIGRSSIAHELTGLGFLPWYLKTYVSQSRFPPQRRSFVSRPSSFRSRP